jgi:hypothetical protein
MNIAHDTHFTDTPDPRIPLVLRGWGEVGQPAQIDEELGDLRVRNVTSDLRGPFGEGGRKDGNSIFIFEAAGLCIGHLGHLHQVLSDAQHAAIGRLDVVMVPVDGGFTMDPDSMAKVVTRFRARLVLPMHWFSADGLVSFVKRMQPTFEVEIISGPEVEVSLETLPRRPTILVLEPALIEMAIGNATAADFARMDECNHRAELSTTLDDFEKWDTALHEAIADAAHNGFITSVFHLMSQARSQNEWGMLKRRSATPERRLEYQQEHRALVDALKNRDAQRAKALCLAHLVHVRVNMLGS